MKKDIEDRRDIELLINTFYEQVKADPSIGYIFNDIARVNWESHLPKMYAFWASLLLGDRSYNGNPMQKHIELSRLTDLTEFEFNIWLTIFKKTADRLFEGEKTEEAKQRAENIARLMLHKIQSI